MIIGLLRHAIAEDASESNGFSDDSRALTAQGVVKMGAAARGIQALELDFDVVLSSPLVRCMQTAQIVAQQIDRPMYAVERLRPGLDAERLLDVLLDFPDANRVLVCGHQPDMSDVAYDLLRGGVLEFKKGALAVIDLSTPRLGAGLLQAHYPPSVLRVIGDAAAATHGSDDDAPQAHESLPAEGMPEGDAAPTDA